MLYCILIIMYKSKIIVKETTKFLLKYLKETISPENGMKMQKKKRKIITEFRISARILLVYLNVLFENSISPIII